MIDKVNLAKTNLTFDDVYIRPKYSDIASRTECDVASNFTKRRRVKTPLIAAPMDTVCESVMMAEMWRLGGVGILHRFGSIDWQVEEASMACFAINMIRESPPTDANMFADVDT